MIAAMALVPLLGAACTTSGLGDSDDGALTQADANAMADVIFAEVQSSGATDIGTQSISMLDAPNVTIDTSVHPLANCTPQRLTPVRQCAFGGNVYTTINQTCPDYKTFGACCGAKPACTKFTGHWSGQHKLNFNGCKSARQVTEDGTINATMTADLDATCGGGITFNMKIVHNGSYSVRVNGRDACPGGVSLTTTVTYAGFLRYAMQGTICGFRVANVAQGPCDVTCPSGCCPAGTYCGRCNKCLPQAYPVDCCDNSCPSGTKCNGNQCTL
jgi:hypothetical protein